MNQFVMVFIGFDAQEGQRQQNGAGVEKFEFAELPHLAGGPRQQRGDGRKREQQRVDRAERTFSQPCGHMPGSAPTRSKT